jgi:phosphoribosyl 1,2-cyclic phosphate phosphodiesterase
MKSSLIILGCGSSIGVPRIDGFWGKSKKSEKKNYRTRCSAVIVKGSNTVLIDASPDIKNQFLLNKLKNVSSVIFTHEHADQTNGLFELRPFFWKNKARINVYGDLKTINLIKKRQGYLFKATNKLYSPILKSNIIKNNFSLGKDDEKIDFKTSQVHHGVTSCLAYIFEKTAYISDTDDLSIIKNKNLRNLKYLILDCLKFTKHPSHFSLEESLYVHQQLKPKMTILTNLHHDLDYNYLLKILPKNVVPAYDGLRINL